MRYPRNDTDKVAGCLESKAQYYCCKYTKDSVPISGNQYIHTMYYICGFADAIREMYGMGMYSRKCLALPLWGSTYLALRGREDNIQGAS